MLDERLYSVALSICACPGGNNIGAGINESGPSEIFNRLSDRIHLKTQDFIASNYSYSPLNASKRIIDDCESKSIRIISYWDNDYPPLLREIDRPPLVIYCRGNPEFFSPIAIVGTRKADPKSLLIARRIASELSKEGHLIISGMAIGIDREAHLGALEGGTGTVGILANGIDIMYPAANRELYKKIENCPASGLISEYPPGIYAGKWTFVRRNRIISGLSLGTLVVKAGKKSGAMITAKHALEQNREVYACPGYAYSDDYAGCNELIKNGAVLVTEAGDILREFPDYSCYNLKKITSLPVDSSDKQVSLFPEDEDSTDPDDTGSRILEFLNGCSGDMDTIIRELGIKADIVQEKVMILELTGKIIRCGNLLSKV